MSSPAGSGRGGLPLLMLGVGTILFGVFTGIPSGLFLRYLQDFERAAAGGTEASRQAYAEFTGHWEQSGLEDARGARDRASVKERTDLLRDLNRHDALAVGMEAFRRAPSTAPAKVLGHLDSFLKFVYVVLGFALLLRLVAARLFGLLLAGVHLLLSLSYAFFMGQSLEAFAGAAGPLIDQVIETDRITSLQAGFVQAWAQRFPYVFAAMSASFPLILLLILRRKAGLARHLRIVLFGKRPEVSPRAEP